MADFCFNGIPNSPAIIRFEGGFRAVRTGHRRPLSERNPEVNVDSI